MIWQLIEIENITVMIWQLIAIEKIIVMMWLLIEIEQGGYEREWRCQDTQ